MWPLESGFFHSVGCFQGSPIVEPVPASFCLASEDYSITRRDHVLFIHSFCEGYWGFPPLDAGPMLPWTVTDELV